jgi:hypothetical protein
MFTEVNTESAQQINDVVLQITEQEYLAGRGISSRSETSIEVSH